MYYKDMEVWKCSMKLVKDVYQLISIFPKDEIYGLTSQIKRAAISVPSNIAEGCSRYSDKDTCKFIDIALGSIAELDTQLILAQDLGFAEYNQEVADSISKLNALLQGLKKYTQNSKFVYQIFLHNPLLYLKE